MPGQQRGLAFLCESGRVVKVKEAICWRFLEGRTCCASAQRFRSDWASGASEKGESKSRVLTCKSPDVAVVPIAPAVNQRKRQGPAEQADIDLLQADEALGLSEAEAVAARTFGLDIVLAAKRAGAAAAAAGLAVEVDLSAKWRAAQKFDDWERRGVHMRIEIGLREAESDTVTAWVHRDFHHLAAVDREQAPQDGLEGGNRVHSAPADSCRLRGLSLSDAVAVCCAVASARPPLATSQPAPPAVVKHVPGGDSGVPQSVEPSLSCQRLHLQPACGSEGSGNRARVCTQHLRFLTGTGRACHCGSGHIELESLKDLLAAAHEKVAHSLQRHACRTVIHAITIETHVQQLLTPSLAAAHAKVAGRRVARWLKAGEKGELVGRGIYSHAHSQHFHSAQGSGSDGPGDPEAEDTVAVGESASNASHAGKVTVQVGNIPRDSRLAHVLEEVRRGFAACGIELPATDGKDLPASRCCRNGFWRIGLPSLSQAVQVCEAFGDNGPTTSRLEVDGHVLSVSLLVGRVDALFPNLPYAVRSQLRLDSVAAYSVAHQAVADLSRELLVRVSGCYFGDHVGAPKSGAAEAGMVDLAVTDATACAGGLVLSLMLRFRVLNAVEVDADRVEDLRHNVQLVLDAGGAAGAGVTTHFSDYNAVACTLRQDILVIDPPWGGAAYSALPQPLADLKLGDQWLSQVTAHALSYHAPIVLLRLPSKFDCKAFADAVSALPCTGASCPAAAAHPLCAPPAAEACCGRGGRGGPDKEASSGATWLDIEVRAGRSKILLCCRLPADAGESAALIQRLRLTLSRLCNAPLPESPEASECRGHGQASSNAGHGQARDQTRSPSPSASPEQRRVSQKGGGRGCSKLPYRIGRQARQLGYM